MAAAETNIDALVDRRKLTLWLGEHAPQLGSGELAVQMVHGGTTNVILSVSRGAGEAILRRPPALPPPNSENTVVREARVLTALNGTPVPHPRCLASCADASVIGAPFYLMERAPGWAADLRDEHIYHRAPFDRPPYEYGIAYAMIDGLVALANVDYRSVGLEGFGKPDGFLERQVERWSSQLASYGKLYGYAGRELPGYEYARDWLRSSLPKGAFQAGIMHGDVGTPNALFADGPPARLNALIDWELCTIGDPLMDLASFTSGMRDEREPDRVPGKSLYNAENFPTRQELARYYAAGTGRDLSHFPYFQVLTSFKSGCLLEYKVAQSQAGMMSKETGVFFSRLVLECFAEAERMARAAG